MKTTQMIAKRSNDMNAFLRCLTIMEFLLLPYDTAVSNSFNPGGEPFQLIAIFSNCNNNLHPSTTSYYQTAQVCKKSMDWVMENKDFVANGTEVYNRAYKNPYFKHPRKWSVDNVEYLSYDVCTQEDGARLAVEIVLNRKYFVNITNGFPMWRDDYILYGERTTKKLKQPKAFLTYFKCQYFQSII